MYAAVPSTWPVIVTDASLATVAIPKSPTARRPCSSSRRLAGLTSRCTTSWACAQSSAIAVSRSQRTASGRGGGGRGERAPAAQALGERPAGEVLHDDVGAVVVLADVVDGHDVPAVAEPRGGAGLAQEALAGALGRVVGAREQLHRDEAAEELVLGLPHGGHPAARDVAHHAIPGREGDPLFGCRHRPDATRADRPVHSCLLMAKVCHCCGKGPAFGNNRSHSMVATRRRFDPNLQKFRIMVA